VSRPQPMRRRAFIAGALATPFVAACGGSGDDAASSTTARPTTTSSTSTTAPPPVQPLTGLPHQGDPAVLARPALVAKVDNADGAGLARPQAGINQADVVIEERVEGSVTRLAAVFHSQDADPVGPIRSFRTTDLHIVANLNRPLLAWSGANAVFARMAREGPLVDVGYDVATDAYYRERSRRAPHNLMTATPALRAHTPEGAGPPPPLFTYRQPGVAPVGGRPVADVRISYGGGGGSAPVNYRVDPATGTWLRFQRDTPHVDEVGAQVQVENVVIMHVDYVSTGAVDSGGNAVPEAELIGSGVAWVLTGGMLVEGTWSRPSEDAIAALTDAAGAPIALTPGRTWVALPELGGTSVVA
jgi:hypothetical protein